MRKLAAVVAFLLFMAILPNVIPSQLLLTNSMAIKMVHKSTEWGLSDPEALSTAYLLAIYAAIAAAASWLVLRLVPKKSA
ncbi:hypothetical protein [Serratia sp. BNK-4]|uniref:hypothetical protein n=1 Tax=Serratia sp. BNK-4 TaxID=3376141 RepID=UPI003B436A29